MRSLGNKISSPPKKERKKRMQPLLGGRDYMAKEKEKERTQINCLTLCLYQLMERGVDSIQHSASWDKYIKFNDSFDTTRRKMFDSIVSLIPIETATFGVSVELKQTPGFSWCKQICQKGVLQILYINLAMHIAHVCRPTSGSLP